jgi:16S rRNA processing protein RimM
MRPERVVIGRILRAHGIRGELKVRRSTDLTNRFKPGSNVLLVRGGKDLGEFEIERVRVLGELIGVKFRGIESREDADGIKGSDIEVPPADLDNLPDDTYYVFDLVGMQVWSDEDQLLGEVTEVAPLPANDVLTVRDGEKAYQIPMIADVIRDVAVSDKRITVHLLPGLLDL